MPEEADYQAFCDRVCSYVMSYELGIPFQWDIPLLTAGNGGRGSGVREDIRLSATDRRVHSYQRTPAGEEYEIQPEEPLWWLPVFPSMCPHPPQKRNSGGPKTCWGSLYLRLCVCSMSGWPMEVLARDMMGSSAPLAVKTRGVGS